MRGSNVAKAGSHFLQCSVRAPMTWAVFFLGVISLPAYGQLLNPSFDDNGGSLVNWTTFNNWAPNVLAAPITPLSETHVAKVFGAFNGNPNYSGLLQSVPANEGEEWEASAFCRHNSGDSLVGTNNSLIMKIEFYRVAGGEYGTVDMLLEDGIVILDADSPLNEWLYRSFQVTAPAETVEARIAFVFVQFDNAGGAALVDDVGLTTGSEPPLIEWSLIWQDEFDGSSVDPTKWRIEDIHLIKNNELQYYTPEDVYVENGNLVLRSQNRSYKGFDTNGVWRWFSYTSGLVESVDRFATAYGKVEVRAKLPYTQGIWPAHWMLPTSEFWPPEIDIIELLGHEPTRVYMTHHWGYWPNVQSHGSSYAGPDFSQAFHTFAIQWMPDRIDWFVDDVRRFTSTVAIPQEPFYIILNTAVGGNWPGNPDGTTVFPQYHEIDYVRVYMPADSGGPLLEIVDTTSASATPDGQIDAGEYIGSTTGINSGFGDQIGESSLLYVDSGSDGRLNFAIHSGTAWPDLSTNGVVFYIDSVDGGYASTVQFHDVADTGRRLVSAEGPAGEQAGLYFPAGFRAEYAVVLQAGSAEVYELGETSHQLINGADLGALTDIHGGDEVLYRLDDGSFGLRMRELEIRLAHVGVAQGGSFDFVATLLDGDTAYRSNEFVGVAAGNPWDGGNIGNNPAVLKPGDFVRFHSAPPPDVPIPTVSEWGLAVLTLLLVTAGTLVLRWRECPACVCRR